MSNDANQNSTEVIKEKRSVSRYIIPILGGAIIWVGLLGVGIKVLQGMVQAKSTSQQVSQTKTKGTENSVVNSAPAQNGAMNGVATGTSDGATAETTDGTTAGATDGATAGATAGATTGTTTGATTGATTATASATSTAQQTTTPMPQNETIANSRYALQMQDDQGNLYAVYLYAPNEMSTTHSASQTAAAMPGDKLFSGDYETYVGPVDGSSVQKQTMTLPHYTFNGARRQAYVVNGHAQLLVVTQTADYNGVTSRIFTLKNGKLVPVSLLIGRDSKSDLYMVSMRATANDTDHFQSISYDKPSGHYWLTTWQYDPTATVLRQVGKMDLSTSSI